LFPFSPNEVTANQRDEKAMGIMGIRIGIAFIKPEEGTMESVDEKSQRKSDEYKHLPIYL